MSRITVGPNLCGRRGPSVTGEVDRTFAGRPETGTTRLPRDSPTDDWALVPSRLHQGFMEIASYAFRAMHGTGHRPSRRACSLNTAAVRLVANSALGPSAALVTAERATVILSLC